MGTPSFLAITNVSRAGKNCGNNVVTFEIPEGNVNAGQGAHEDGAAPVEPAAVGRLPNTFDFTTLA